jgi:subtilisin family serine protease
MRIVALFVSSLIGTVSAASPHLSPRLRLMRAGMLPTRALMRGPTDDDSRVLVTVKVYGGAAALVRAGFRATALSSHFASLRVSREELERLGQLHGVERIEERRLLHPTLNAAAAAVGAPAARASTGFDGTGVLVGVVDTGVDFRHADLRDQHGHTRIEALLDLSATTDSRHPDLSESEGAVWLRDEIEAALVAEALGMTPAVPVTEKDTSGHGTHVSGIALGGGLGSGHGLPAGRYVGMAPGARLMAVQATRGGDSFSDADILSGCKFLIEQAAALGRPLVVNLSLGGDGGPHDGSSSFEESLEELFPLDMPGRALVVAAGNSGSLDRHAGVFALHDEVVLELLHPALDVHGEQVALEVWYDGDLSVTVESPSGVRYGPIRGGSGLGSPAGLERVAIDNASGGIAENGLRDAGIVLASDGGALQEGTWKIRLAGRSTRLDAWIIESPDARVRFGESLSVDDRLELPGTTRSAIVVGSFVSKSSWINVDGVAIERGLTLSAPSSFSSPGPTRDGRFSPDLLAPGEFIASTLSADAPPTLFSSVFFVPGDTPNYLIADDGVHGLLRGTSQATPMVAGAVALLFQANPMLTAGQAREILRVSAHADTGFSPKSGFGLLDLFTALRLARGERGGAVSAKHSTVGTSRDFLPPGELTFVASVTPKDDSGMPLGPGHAVEISSSAGEPIGAVTDTGQGRYERTFVAHAARGATGVIFATVDGVALDARPEVHFVAARAEVGQRLSAGAGCEALPHGPAAGGKAAMALLGVALLLWKSRTRRDIPPRT